MIWPSYTQIQAKLGRGPCGNPCWLCVLQCSIESLVACFANQDLLHDFAMLCSPFVVAEHWLQTLAQQISQRQHVFSQTTANYKTMDLKWYLHHLLQIEVDLHSFLPSCPAYLYSLSRPSAFSLRFVHLGWKCAVHFMNCRADCRVHFDIIFIYIYIYLQLSQCFSLHPSFSHLRLCVRCLRERAVCATNSESCGRLFTRSTFWETKTVCFLILSLFLWIIAALLNHSLRQRQSPREESMHQVWQKSTIDLFQI